MKKTLLSILLMILLGTSIFAQPNFAWVNTVGGTNVDVANSVTVDLNGNIYTTGYFEGTVDFDPGVGVMNLTSNGGEDIYVQKLSPTGNLIWAKSFGGTNTSDRGIGISTDLSGNVITVGNMSSTIDFDPGPGVSSLTSNGSNDVFVQKLDENGNFLWAKNIGGTSTDFVRSVCTDQNGNIYLTGQFYVTVDFDPGVGSYLLTSNGSYDAFVEKLDSNGNFIWARSMGTTTEEDCYSVAVDAFGNVYTTGDFRNTVDFDPSANVFDATSNGNRDIYIHKLDVNGNFVWVKTMGGTSFDSGASIHVDVNGDIYTTGTFSETVDFDPGTGVLNYSAIGTNDVFVHKMNDNGDLIWANVFGGTVSDYASNITTDSDGNVYISGRFKETIDLDPATGVINYTSNGLNDLFIQKLNSTGALVWAKSIGGSGSDDGTAICTDQSNNIYISGYYTNTVDFDPGLGVVNQTSNGAIDFFVLKLQNCVPTTSSHSHTACNSYIWNGTTYNSTGTYTYVTSNAAGCDSTATLNLTIEDVTAPIANVVSLSNITSECSVTSLTAPTATDNCAGAITGTHNATLPITTQGTTVVTWTYNDGNGNTSTQTQNVIIDDVSSPVADLNSLTDILASCEVNNLNVPTATDNCAGSVTATHNVTLPLTVQGTTVVTWTYDDGNGNISTQTQNVIIDDVTAPVANVASLSDITAQCSVTSLTAPTATDNCAGTITGTHNATLPITTQETTVVTWTYNDGNGNTSTQTQNVIIDDVTAPVANVASLSDIIAQCSVTILTAPSATDNCAGTITGTHNTTLPITAQGTTVVTWTYNDGNGNTSTQTQNVVIDDVTAPVADVATLSDVTSECQVTALTAPTATDNCVGTITGTHNATLPITNQGTTVVTWTYNDGNGNTSTQTQNVIVSGPNVDVTQIDAVTLSADLSGANYQWIDCANGNQPINGETNQIFVATANGNYAVIVDNGTCADTSVCFTISTVGIDANEVFKQVKVYPNPTNGVFTIDLGEQYEQVSIRLMNNLGQLIQEDQYKSVDKLNLTIHSEPGVYFLEGHINQTQQFRINLVKQ